MSLTSKSRRSAGAEPPPPVLLLVGATATGKSRLAVEVARAAHGEVVSADSMQVYRGMDIGTAKPAPADRQGVAHHLLDILDPGCEFSAGEFVRRADDAVAGIRRRGRLAVVAGGTGFYVRAWLRGLAPAPARQPAVRAALARRAEEEGTAVLHAELAAVDPAGASRIGSGDRQRTIRALEVALESGRPLGAWWAAQETRVPAWPLVKFGLRLPRVELYRRIDARVVAMFANELVEECGRLIAAGVPRDAHAWKAIGYRQALAVLDGAMDLPAAVAAAQRDTRRYAKRQETWFRSEPGIEWLDAADLQEACATILRRLG